MMVRSGDDDGIQVDLIQQHAIVGVPLRLWVSRTRRIQGILIYVAQGGDRFRGDRVQIPCPPPSNSNRPHPQSLVGTQDATVRTGGSRYRQGSAASQANDNISSFQHTYLTKESIRGIQVHTRHKIPS
jgi:hypothetical protein